MRLGLEFLEQSRKHLDLCPLTKPVCDANKRLGLGIMGFADLLKEANIPYDSRKALDMAHLIGSCMQEVAFEFRQHHDGHQHRKVLAIAPTGGTSLITGASFSIEPFLKEA